MTAAVVICVLLILTTLGGLVVVHYAEQPASGKHVKAGAAPEPPPLPAAGRLPMLPDEPAGWRDEEPPPPAVEVLAGPGRRIAQTSEPTLGVLGRVRDALLPDAWQPGPGEATFTPADPDVTWTDLQPVTRNLAERYQR